MMTLLHRMWKGSAPLTVCCVSMLIALIASAAGILFDPRVIGGAPAWLKPAKFAISTAIFAGTMALILPYLTDWPKLRRASEWVLSGVLLVEVALIDLQAARGTTSHFNAGSALDGAIFATMGIAIAVLWIDSVLLTYAFFCQPFADRAWGWSIRMGALIYVIGAAAAGLMLGPTAQQKEELRAHQAITVIGGHTVGAPDGGEGIPGVGWSLHHGDLRIPHFFGLHALQILPLFGWLITRTRRSARLVFAAAASYLVLIGILGWQALRGQSIMEPDGTTLIAFAGWAALTGIASIWLARKPETYDSRTPVLSV